MGEMNTVVLAASGGGTSNFLIPNGTFFFVLAIFLIVLGVIAKWVVPPISKVLAAREAMLAKTAEDNKRAAELSAAAEADRNATVGRARREAAGIRDEARAQGRTAIEDARGRAGDEVAENLRRTDEDLTRQGEAATSDLRASVETLSATLAGRVLGVEVAPTNHPTGR